MVPLRAFLFDLGETLYTYQAMPPSWTEHYRRAMETALSSVGVDSSRYDLGVAERRLGQFNTRLIPRQKEAGAARIFAPILDSYRLPQALQPRIVAAFFDYYRASLVPYSETSAVLATLRGRGLKTGALTDVAYGMPRTLVEEDLRKVGLLNLLDFWLTSVDVGWRKPNPAGYRQLCGDLEVDVDEAVYVGNEEKDIRGAKAAGLRAVLLCRDGSAAPGWGQDAAFSDLKGCLCFA